MAQKVVFITTIGAGTFTVPVDFASLVSVEAIGGGGGGGSSTSNGGGGGGAYAKSTSVTSLVAGGTAYYSVGIFGVGGSTGTAGGDSWFNAASNAAPTLNTQGCLAKGGGGGGNSGGSGGASASCIPITGAFSGGTGGNPGGTSAGGGGGAAGPGGIGGNGSAAFGTGQGKGGGGGGASLLAAGNNAGTATSTNGGSGGNGGSGTGGGTAGTNAINATSGTAGTGGGGGGGGTFGGDGGAGGTGSYWTQSSNSATAGSGGGGGGGNGVGGLYGGGGSGSGTNGAQGIIVFTYNVSATGQGNIPYQPGTGFRTTDPNTNNTQDLGSRYITKDYLLDVYPNIASSTGNRTAPGLWGWGVNDTGQLGNGNTTYYSSPVQVGSLTNWKQVSSNQNTGQVAAIKTDGTLWTWGVGFAGALGLSNTVSYSSPVQVGALTNWKQVEMGVYTCIAIKTDGTLWGWGRNSAFGQVGNNSLIDISSPVQIGALTNWKQVSTTNSYAVAAIKTDGTLWTWGYNLNGQLGVGNITNYSSPVQVGTLTTWKQVVCKSATYAIKTDGTLWAWGDNSSGQLGIGNRTSYSSPVQVGSLTNWKQLYPGSSSNSIHAIKTDGTLWAWGDNSLGILGINNTRNYSSPVQVGALTNWKAVATGSGYATLALKTDGTLWGWGNNSYGQIGLNNTAYFSSPVQVGTLTTWKAVSGSIAIQDGYI